MKSATSYDLYWSPEGRKIATVSANSRKAAIKKTPKPYHKALGEVYATNAWRAEISLWSEGFLLGGTKKHVSSAFVRKTDAENFAQQSVQVNRDRPGYQNADITAEVVACYDLNPIPAVD